jgi:hypothetical protein
MTREKVMKIKNYIPVVLLAMFAVWLWSCASSGLSFSPKIPAAEGTVKFAKADNGNTNIHLVVKHLANPHNLTPSANAYVVWVQDDKKSTPEKIGVLVVDQNLDGELKGVTSLHNFEMFVTGETSGQVNKPTGDSLFWTSYNK